MNVTLSKLPPTRFNHTIETLRTAFVIGPPRCGTTLLAFLLGGAPGMMSLSEPYLAQFIFSQPRLRRHFSRLAKKQKLDFLSPPAEADPLSFLRYLQRLAANNNLGGLIIKETFREQREWDNQNVLDWIAGTGLPVAGITRHPYDAAASTLKFCRWWRGLVGRALRLYVPGLPLFRNNEELMEYFAFNWSRFVAWSRKHQLPVTRYEELVSNPQHSVRQICAQCSLSFDSAMLDHKAPRAAFGGIGAPELMNRPPRPVHTSSVGRERDLPHRLVEIVRRGTAAAAAELGYDV